MLQLSMFRILKKDTAHTMGNEDSLHKGSCEWIEMDVFKDTEDYVYVPPVRKHSENIDIPKPRTKSTLPAPRCPVTNITKDRTVRQSQRDIQRQQILISVEKELEKLQKMVIERERKRSLHIVPKSVQSGRKDSETETEQPRTITVGRTPSPPIDIPRRSKSSGYFSS